MSVTNIEWTDRVWNPVIGCSRVSEGCRNCYAERMAQRIASMDTDAGRTYARVVRHKDGAPLPQWSGSVELLDDRLDEPLRWRKPSRVFVNSMSDLFHAAVPFEFVDRVFAVMALCQQHTFQVLTKRPERAVEYFLTRRAIDDSGRIDRAPQWYQVVTSMLDDGAESMPRGAWQRGHDNMPDPSCPLPNLWFGISVEDQAAADERIPHLLRIPAAVRWLSVEPMLGAIDVKFGQSEGVPSSNEPFRERADLLHWVVCGGESGPGARPMNPDWVRSIRDQCVAADVPFFFKQWGEWLPGNATGPPSYSYRSASDGTMMSRTRRTRRDNLGSDTDRYSGNMIALRVGKRAAGRELDGRTWDQYPIATGGES